jgi:glucokinase
VTEVVLAIDAGGTKLLGGLVTRTGETLDVDEVATPRAPSGCDPGLVALVALAGRLRRAADAAGHLVRGVGVGFPEYVRDGVVTSAEVFAWERQPAEVLADVVPGRPVVVEADVRCAAVAEARVRRASGLFYVSWGTGLSSSLVVSGMPVPGRRGEALALGEWPVSAAVDAAWPGNLERYAAGLAIADRYRERTGVGLDGRAVVGQAADGDPVAVEIVDSAAGALAYALAQVVHLLDPEVVVLGGGLGASRTRPPQLVAELLPRLLARPDPPPIEPAIAGPRAGLVGAGLLGFHAIGP